MPSNDFLLLDPLYCGLPVYRFAQRASLAALESPRPVLPGCNLCRATTGQQRVYQIQSVQTLAIPACTPASTAALWDGKLSPASLTPCTTNYAPAFGVWPRIKSRRLASAITHLVERVYPLQGSIRLQIEVVCGGVFKIAWVGFKPRGPGMAGVYAVDQAYAGAAAIGPLGPSTLTLVQTYGPPEGV
jgi:hypothetical protein